LADLTGTIGRLFVERRDVYAIQYANGHYEPCREKLGRAALEGHLAGTKTIGHYLVSPEDKCRLFAYDIDLAKTGTWTDETGEQHDIAPREVWLDPTHPAREDLTISLRCMAEGLAARIRRTLEIPVAIAYSGNKGLHVYAFTGSEPAADVRSIGIELLQGWGCFEAFRGEHFWRHAEGGYPNLEIEIFPKQDSLAGKDFGNLMRLPLGVNRKSGQRGFFLDVLCGYNELRELDPLIALAGDPWQGKPWRQ